MEVVTVDRQELPSEETIGMVVGEIVVTVVIVGRFVARELVVIVED